jgi:hypothetical protein
MTLTFAEVMSLNYLVNNELETMWKEDILAYFQLGADIPAFYYKMNYTTKNFRMDGVRTEILI